MPTKAPSRLGGFQSIGGAEGMPDLSGIAIQMQSLFGGGRSRTRPRKVKIGKCRPILEDVELDNLMNMDVVIKEAIRAVEQVYCQFL